MPALTPAAQLHNVARGGVGGAGGERIACRRIVVNARTVLPTRRLALTHYLMESGLTADPRPGSESNPCHRRNHDGSNRDQHSFPGPT